MQMITQSGELKEACKRLSSADYITVDTEFLRDSTFWPKLCLVQMAGPDDVLAIDPLVEGIDLSPLFELMVNHDVLKVFHAARQDIEIFYYLSKIIPEPLFDTQVAAMVCGFGDSVGYETLASNLANAKLDKSSRFTDWSHRPLSERQLTYAIGDVTHLRTVYEKLSAKLEQNGRTSWLDEEMSSLMSPALYTMLPEDAWKRLKTKANHWRTGCYQILLECRACDPGPWWCPGGVRQVRIRLRLLTPAGAARPWTVLHFHATRRLLKAPPETADCLPWS